MRALTAVEDDVMETTVDGSAALGARANPGAATLLGDSLLAAAADGCATLDRDGCIVAVNDALCQMTGYSRAELIGRGAASLCADRQDRRDIVRLARQLRRRGHAHGEVWARRRDGGAVGAWLSLSALPAGGQASFLALLTDVTALRLRREHERYLARVDTSTGLPNRAQLHAHIAHAVARAMRTGDALAVYVVAIDALRKVRGDWGHEAGERLLWALAARLGSVLAPRAILARSGDDAFAVLLRGGNAAIWADCAEALRRCCVEAGTAAELGVDVRLVAAVGYAVYPGDAADADALLACAEQAVGEARAAGGNAWRRFDVERARSMQRLGERLDEVREAIAAGDFVVHYQPQVHMPSGRLCGAEALVRWRHRERGLVRPDAFLDLIEGNSLIAAFTLWLLDAVLGQIAQWRAQGLDIPVNLNVAPYHLRHPEFVPLLRAALARHPSVPAGMLVLDVTERSIAEDAAAAARNVAACRAIGVSVALDDFGHGDASLSALRALQADVVKIDQRVVRGMLDDAADADAVRGIVGLSRALRKGVIAEGVETPELARALLRAGCEYAQGYAIAQPMPPQQLAAWTRAWRPDADWRSAVQH